MSNNIGHVAPSVKSFENSENIAEEYNHLIKQLRAFKEKATRSGDQSHQFMANALNEIVDMAEQAEQARTWAPDDALFLMTPPKEEFDLNRRRRLTFLLFTPCGDYADALKSGNKRRAAQLKKRHESEQLATREALAQAKDELELIKARANEILRERSGEKTEPSPDKLAELISGAALMIPLTSKATEEQITQTLKRVLSILQTAQKTDGTKSETLSTLSVTAVFASELFKVILKDRLQTVITASGEVSP